MSKRSSTFSFDHVPRLGGTALCALVLALLGLLSLEVVARARGHEPSVFDDDDLYCLHWDRVHDAKVLALVGSSRSRAGFSAPVFYERYPGTTFANLTLAGLCPLATLARLAEDEEFKGDVIYDVAENCVLAETRNHQRSRIEQCREHWHPGDAFNRWLRLQLEPHWVLMHPRVSLANLAQSLWAKSAFPAPDYWVTSGERLNSMDFSRVGAGLGKERVARLRAEHARHPPPTPAQWLSEARLTEKYIQRIQARGGRVTVVRFPTSGEFWKLDQSAYPRDRYWDAFAAFSQAELIHFQDLPTRDLACGDQSHLNGTDAPAFTRALFDEMERRAAARH